MLGAKALKIWGFQRPSLSADAELPVRQATNWRTGGSFPNGFTATSQPMDYWPGIGI
jgi:hypothetical protein